MVHEFPYEDQTSIRKVTAKFYQFHAHKRISSISSLASNVIIKASAQKGISHNHLSRTSTTLIQHVDVELALANITAVGIQTVLESLRLVHAWIHSHGRRKRRGTPYSSSNLLLHHFMLNGAGSHDGIHGSVRHGTPCPESHPLRNSAGQTSKHRPSTTALLNGSRRWSMLHPCWWRCPSCHRPRSTSPSCTPLTRHPCKKLLDAKKKVSGAEKNPPKNHKKERENHNDVENTLQ